MQRALKMHLASGNDLKTFLLHRTAFLCVSRFLWLASFGTVNALMIAISVIFQPLFSVIPKIFLKPVKVEDVKQALDKYKKLTHQDVIHYLSKLTQLMPTPKYKDKLLIPYKDKLLPIGLKEVSCFYTADKNTCIYLKDGNMYPYSKTLEQIMASLNPADFIRANKQFIIARNSVTDITIWFDNRLLVTLDVETPERIYISKNKASEFKSWIVNNT